MKQFEVMVTEHNPNIGWNGKDAFWTMTFESKSEALDYMIEVNEINTEFNKRFVRPITFCCLLVTNPHFTPAVDIQEFSA